MTRGARYKEKVNATSLTLRARFFRLALPNVLSNLMVPLAGLVDTAMLRSAVEIWRHSSLWTAWVRWLQFTQEQKQQKESKGKVTSPPQAKPAPRPRKKLQPGRSVTTFQIRTWSPALRGS